jgi:hypothetical protein
MNGTKLLELAERCEAAEGPDRELDCLIAAALELRPEGMDISAADSLRIWGLHEFARHSESHQNVWSRCLPRYTASIDAALTLVPEGMWVACLTQDDTGWWAGLCRPGERQKDWLAGWGPTPSAALALTAAALRALASTERQDDR